MLTAAHVVTEARSVKVRFSDRVVEADVRYEDPETDVAVLCVREHGGQGGEVPTTLYGAVGDHDAKIACSSVGFPLFKFRGNYRDSFHLTGSIPALSNRRERTLEVEVSLPPQQPEDGRSPWEGMSGAALFAGERLIGLITKHHPWEGPGRVTASRADGWRLDPAVATLIGLPDELDDVVPPRLGAPATARHLAHVRNLTPRERLVGRERELAEWAAFAFGDEPYQWWHGQPWAGKTALAATFVLEPPYGVRVASFFAISRMAESADAGAFLRTMIEQLAEIAGEPPIVEPAKGAQYGQLARLLESAAERCEQAGQRLVLVVDGLDEDLGSNPSIARLLPHRPPAGVGVLVTSRSSPGVPDDVPGDHPLRQITPRVLAPSESAHDIEISAKAELYDVLRAQNGDRELVGLLAAARSGLTVPDLAELTRRDRYDLELSLSGRLGRSVMSQPIHRRAELQYLFAHETLRAKAEQALNLAPFRELIDDWADGYRDLGWPKETPQYLLGAYSRALIHDRRPERLLRLAADAARHNRMLIDASDMRSALAEVESARDLIEHESQVSLLETARLTAEYERLRARGNVLPAALPAVFAALGQVDLARSLAFAAPDALQRSIALAQVSKQLVEVDAVAARGLVEDALQAVRNSGHHDRGTALCLLLEPSNAVGTVADVNAMIAEVRKTMAAAFVPLERWRIELALTLALGAIGRFAEAEAMIADMMETKVGRPQALATALGRLAHSVSAVDRERSRQYIHRALELGVGTYAELALAISESEPDWAADIAKKAYEGLPAGFARPHLNHGWIAARVAEALAKTGQVDSARNIVAEYHRFRLDDSDVLETATSAIISALVRDGELAAAEHLAAESDDGWVRTQNTMALVQACIAAGLLDTAEAHAERIADPHARMLALTALADAYSTTDLLRSVALADNALAALHLQGDRNRLVQALGVVAKTLAPTDASRASAAVRLASAANEAAAPANRHDNSAAIAAAAAVADGVASAEEIISQIPGNAGHVNAIEEVTRFLALHGRLTDAIRFIEPWSTKYEYYSWPSLGRLLGSDHTGNNAALICITVCACLHGSSEDAFLERRAVMRDLVAQGILTSDIMHRALLDYAAGNPHPHQGDNEWGPVAARRMELVEALCEAAVVVAADGKPGKAQDLINAAQRLANQVPEDRRRYVLWPIAVALAEFDPARARRLTQSIELDRERIDRGSPYAENRDHLVSVLARLGEFDQAEQVANSIESSRVRHRILATIADCAWKTGDAQRARRLTQQTLTSEDHWLIALPVLNKLQPDAFDGVYHSLMHDWPASLQILINQERTPL